jgi:hypothetical protein
MCKLRLICPCPLLPLTFRLFRPCLKHLSHSSRGPTTKTIVVDVEDSKGVSEVNKVMDEAMDKATRNRLSNAGIAEVLSTYGGIVR